MEQPEIPEESVATPAGAPQEPAPPPESPGPEPGSEASRKAQLPDPKGALPIPDHFRLPFHGKMVTPTSVPSATQRRYNLYQLRRRRQRRGFLLGLLFAQILIIALDLGGDLYLRTHPQVRLKEPISVAGIVFLGMAIGAAILCVGVALLSCGMGLRGLLRRRSTGSAPPAGRALKRALLTPLILGVTMGVILGTAWFMIPGAEWTRTIEFARRKGIAALEASKSMLRSFLARPTENR